MDYKTPEQIFGNLYKDMQLSGIWEDAKYISDLIPTSEPELILESYQKQKEKEEFSLEAFVKNHFRTAETMPSKYKVDPNQSLTEHIEGLWESLERKPDQVDSVGSLVPLKHGYTVPGGRFNEIFYWDSYFTMLGLAKSGRIKMVSNMVKNFTDLIYQFGHIPNGNRTYFVSRSQPPFFALMIRLLVKYKGKGVLVKYLEALLIEYQFWMSNERIFVKDGKNILNKYHDEDLSPRAEMYAEDLKLAENSNRPASDIYRNIRTAAESGWDFSSRWLDDNMKLQSIKASKMLPVDLNCLLYNLEKTIEKAFELKGDVMDASTFRKMANERKQTILELYDDQKGYFFDFDISTGALSNRETLAGIFPMFFELIPQSQAEQIKDFVITHFLEAGGLKSTTINSGQQWDAPYGSAPLQWITIQALRKYQFYDLADEIADRWCSLVRKVYDETGKLLERYNVVDIDKQENDKFPMEGGFGWTMGVYLDLVK